MKKKLYCNLCGASWNPRTSSPVQCPRCKRVDWAKPKPKRGKEMRAKKKPTTKTKPHTWFVAKLVKMGACSNGIKYVKRFRTFPAFWNACNNTGWLMWLRNRLELAPKHQGTPNDCPGCKWENNNRAPNSIRRQFPADRVSKALRAWGAK